MAVYNPYDQMIFEDPAYLTDPEKVKEQLQEETRGIANIIARTAGPVAGLITDPEAYRQTQDQKQRNQEILQQLGITNRQLNRDEMERAKAAGYVPLTTGQVLGEIPGFLYSDLVAGSEKIRAGVDYYDLDDNERMGVAMGIIDMADIALLPAVFKKLATIGVKKFGKSNLKTMAQDPELQKQFPAETQEILSITGGGFTPAGVMRAAEDGTGPASSMPKGLQIGHEKRSAGRLEKKNRLLKVINEAKESGKKYKQKLDIYNEAGINRGVGKDLGDEFPEIRQATDFLINKPEKSNVNVVMDFINQNPNKNYSAKEISDATGLSMRQINKVKELRRNELQDRIFMPRDEATERRKDMKQYLDNIPEGSFVPSDFFAKEFNVDSFEVGSFLKDYPSYRNKIQLANTYDFGFDRGFETVPQFLKRYIEDTMNDGRFHYRDEILDVDFNGNRINPNSLTAFFRKYKDYKKYFAPTEFQQKTGKGRDIPRVLNNNKEELGYAYVGSGPRRAEYNFLYDYLRSADPNLYPDFKGNKEEFLQMLVDDLKSKNWKELYREDINTIRELDKLREVGTEKIKSLFDTYSEQYPQQFKNLDKGDFVLHLAHNFPLQLMRGDFGFAGSLKGSTRLSLARTNLEHHREIEEEIAKIVKEVNQKYVDKGVGPQKRQKIPPEINKKLTELDKKANKLGTVVYFKFGNQQYKVGNETPPSVDDLVKATEKYFQYVAKQKAGYKPRKTDKNFGDVEIPVGAQKEGGDVDTLTKAKGGEVKPVRMVIGGDPLENLNEQQFSADPAFEGEDYFNQAVESGNLYAFNPGKIFKLFSKTDAVYTPKKLPDPVAEQQAAPPGTTLPTTQVVQPEDFAFQSFTLNKILDPQAPKAGTPDAWRQFLYGGGQGGKVPEAEMFDTGIEQFLDDYAKYYPDQKLTKQQLVDYYEMSPIGNIEIKVKDARRTQPSAHSPSDDPAYKGYVGGSRHQNTGSQPLDEVGTDYREVVVKAGALPGDKKPFVSSGHFEEENVLGFTRVADYMQPDGRKVSVIQEMQTDMLTKVRKEQERLQALLKRIENIKARAARDLQSGDPYREASATNALEQLNQAVPPTVEETLKKHQDLIKPFPNEAAKSTIPDYQKQLSDLQLQIEDVLQKDIQQSRPETGFEIEAIAKEQQQILDSLLDLNRSGQLDDMLKGIKVPSNADTDELMRYGEDTNVRGIDDGTSYYSTKDLELFPPIPFNKQADYVDLLIKSTIKDAQGRGINKVAIFPPELVNQRWGKRPDSDAGKKFRDLYGKVAIQQMKNIAKKYGGEAKVEVILNPDNSDRGLTYFKRNLEGEFDYLKQDQLAQGLDPEEAQMFIDEQLNRNAHALGDKQVIYTKEIAPGQTMDYYVDPYVVNTDKESIKKFNLVPLGPGDDRNAAQIIVEEYNPQEIPMFTITLDSEKAQAPMFMFKKKSGGSIDKDSLVSITDIYGEYGR